MEALNRSAIGLCIGSLLLAGAAAIASEPVRTKHPQSAQAAVASALTPETVVASFEEELFVALRTGAGEIGEAILQAVGQIEHLGGAGAPRFELLRVARHGKAQSFLAANRSVRAINDASSRAASALQAIGAPPRWLRYISRRRAECAESMWDTARWANHLIDEAVFSALQSE